MAQEEVIEPHKSSPQRTGAPIAWWALVGAWLGLFALDGALTGGGRGPSGSWMHLSIALILLGPFLPSLFFDADGQEFSSKGMWTAARRHWSGVVSILLMLSGVGLMVANLLLAPETVRTSDWAFAVVFLVLPLISLLGITGPHARLRLGAMITICVVAAVLVGGGLLYGSRLQWAYAQLSFLMLAAIAVFALLGIGVLRLMDWMIARSERRADQG